MRHEIGQPRALQPGGRVAAPYPSCPHAKSSPIGNTKDSTKTRSQLLSELNELRARLSELGGRTKDQQETLHRVERSEQRFRALIEHALDGIAVLDERGRVVYSSPSAESIWGLPPPSQGPLLNLTYVDHADQRRLVRNFARVLRQPGVPLRGNYRVHLTDGSPRVMETISTNLLHDPNVQGIVVNYCDITRRHAAQERLKRSEAELRLLSQETVKAAEQERARVARDLHDHLGSELAFLQVKAAVLAEHLKDGSRPAEGEIGELVELAERMQTDCHNIVMSLGVTMLDEIGLVRSIEWYAEEFERGTGISCVLDTPVGDIPVDQGCAMAAYRILQEALANVRKHAKASEVDVKVFARCRKLHLTVTDDGIGFDPAGIGVGKSLGLLSMAERARLVGGTFRISSRPGKGTKLTARVPLDRVRPRRSAGPRARKVAA